jgi:hypothetical protein
MTDTSHLNLIFSRRRVRAVVRQGALWFAATDLFQIRHLYTDRKLLSRFGSEHLAIHDFGPEGSPCRLTIVSALGAATVAKALPPPMDRMLDAWVRKRAAELGTSGDMPMTLLADGTLPVRPKAHTHAHDAWWNLKAFHPSPVQRPPVSDAPELVDDDDNVRQPESTGGTFMAELLASGTALLEQDEAAGIASNNSKK